MNQRDPNGYWSGSEAREAQHIYVAFCELASAVLDYCEGTTMRQPPGQSRFNGTLVEPKVARRMYEDGG
jgi:hypothetical protein